MRRIFILMLVGVAYQLQAQSDKLETDLSNLKAPSAPAFTILGINPDEISRPKTFKDLEVQLANSFTNNGTVVIPTNVALEFQPYWLSRHEKLTFERFVENPLQDRLLQNLSISLATAELPGFRDTTALNKRLGFGMRTYVLNGKPTRNQKGIMALSSTWDKQATMTVKMISLLKSALSNESLMTKLATDSTGALSFLNQDISDLTPAEKEVYELLFDKISDRWESATIDSVEDAESFINKEIANIRSNQEEILESLAKSLEKSILDREGWFLETAGALVVDFPTNDINVSYLPKYSFWSTLTHRWVNEEKQRAFESIGMLRYMVNDIVVNENSNVDIGLKIAWQKSRLSLLGEWIFRQQKATISSIQDEATGITTTVVESRDDYRLTFNVNYKLTDQLILIYTVGKGFEVNTEVGGNLLSVLGINYGIGGLNTNSIR